MKAGKLKVPTRFRKETRFEVAIPAVPFRGAVERELEQLKDRVLEAWPMGSENLDQRARYRRAATEAATLAWMTPYPLLVLPLLMEEKLSEARLQAARQAEIRRRSEFIMAEAA